LLSIKISFLWINLKKTKKESIALGEKSVLGSKQMKKWSVYEKED